MHIANEFVNFDTVINDTHVSDKFPSYTKELV